jgi:DNA modification methylase
MGVTILTGDCRELLKGMDAESVHCCVTSPPYFGLRDYGNAAQIGLEQTPEAYVAEMVGVFREVRRVLRDDGTLWLNLGDSYAGSGKGGNPGESPHIKQRTNAGSLSVRGVKREGFGAKPKDLIGIPWRVAFALQADGWYLRNDIIWHKPNPMPESVEDRCTRAHEYVFHLSKSPRYFHDKDAIAEDATYPDDDRKGRASADHKRAPTGDIAGIRPRSEKQRGHSRRHAGFNDRWDAMSKEEQGAGKRNKRSVWTIATRPFSEAHFATMAPELAETCIKAGCPVGGTVLDPFGGAGTSGLMADRLGRSAILCELNPEYVTIARNRIADDAGMFSEVAA